MNKSFYNQENIEAYITNKMSAGDKAFFQNELAKDPLLNNEIDLQKDIINTLKEHRKAELKNRLNNIKIDNTNNYTGLKVAASILLAGLISFGSYNYFSNNKKDNQNTATANNNGITSPEKTMTADNSKPEVITEDEKTTNIINSNTDVQGTVIASNQSGNKTIITKTTRTIKSTENTVESINPTFTTPDVKDRSKEGDVIKTDPNLNMPKGDIGNTNGEYSLDNLQIEKIKDKKHNLFYQYYNNKLFLYGDFDSKPYEILELNTLKDKQVYLYFEDKYYALKQNQIDMAALTLINDKETLKNLDGLRNK